MNCQLDNPVVLFDNVTFRRGERLLFDRFNIPLGTLQSGSVTAIVGASGVGKSTLLRLISKLLAPTSGNIRIAPPDAEVSFLSQEPVIFEHLSAHDNALYLLQARRQKVDGDFGKLVSHLGLEKILKDKALPVSSLSGGERQRLAILRALSIKPKILLLDEPCVGLDPALRTSVVEGLVRAIRDSAVTVLYVTHHIDEIALASDRVLFIEAQSAADSGKNRSVGVCSLTPTESFLAKPPTLAAAKFAMFPRCNVIRGKKTGPNTFVLTEADEPDREAIAFLPTQACLPSLPQGNLRVHSIRGAHAWVEIQGDLIAVAITGKQDIPNKSVLQILPGAILYDNDLRISGVLQNPLNLMIHDNYER